MGTQKTRTIVRGRSAVSGKFVKEGYVKSHPKTTITDRMKVPKKK